MQDVLPIGGSQDVVATDTVVPNYDEMEQFFTSDDLEFVRLSGLTVGTAELTTVELAGVVFETGVWSWANLTRGVTSRRHTIFEMVPEPRDTFFNGVQSEPGLVHTYGPNTELLDTAPPQIRFIVVAIETEELALASEILGRDDPASEAGVFTTRSGEAAAHITRLVTSFAGVASRAGRTGVHETVATRFRDRVVANALSTLGQGSQSAPPRMRHLSALEIVVACDDYASARRYQGITALGLSRAAGYSERRIRAAFKEMTGVPPMQFMRSRAIHEIRRELLSGAGASVTEAAFKWGFTELGRFARAYRNQFGELPSETLRAARHRLGRVPAGGWIH